MNRYTIYCTEEQTRKALELGAPIEANKDYSNGNLPETLCVYGDIVKKDAYGIGECTILHIPTAEQMLGWLEEQINVREICIQRYGNWWYQIYIDPYFHLEQQGFNTRKEATRAAIDAALEYLSNQKSK